jgi:hypothetical protein
LGEAELGDCRVIRSRIIKRKCIERGEEMLEIQAEEEAAVSKGRGRIDDRAGASAGATAGARVEAKRKGAEAKEAETKGQQRYRDEIERGKEVSKGPTIQSIDAYHLITRWIQPFRQICPRATS